MSSDQTPKWIQTPELIHLPDQTRPKNKSNPKPNPAIYFTLLAGTFSPQGTAALSPDIAHHQDLVFGTGCVRTYRGGEWRGRGMSSGKRWRSFSTGFGLLIHHLYKFKSNRGWLVLGSYTLYTQKVHTHYIHYMQYAPNIHNTNAVYTTHTPSSVVLGCRTLIIWLLLQLHN